ncbi:MAG: hypothetical protein AB1815_13460 [Bacillota bacterium]
MLDAVNSSETLEQFVEMAGAKSEEEATAIAWPILILATNLAYKKDSTLLELISPAGTDRTFNISPYLNGQEVVLQEKWLSVMPVPSFQGGRFGWQCRCNTVAEAAAVEMILGFFNGWKRRFRICKKCRRFHHGKECERCSPEIGERKKFQGLLRQHKSRFKIDANRLKKGNPRKEELETAVNAIDNLLKKLQSGISFQVVLREYQDLCSIYRLPQRWVKIYNKGGGS